MTEWNQPKKVQAMRAKPGASAQGPAQSLKYVTVPAIIVNSETDPTMGQRLACGT
jgi:hypothetical protein